MVDSQRTEGDNYKNFRQGKVILRKEKKFQKSKHTSLPKATTKTTNPKLLPKMNQANKKLNTVVPQ